MQPYFISFLFMCLWVTAGFAQTRFSDETKKYIAFSDTVIVFTNALLMDGKGNPSGE